MAAKQPPTENSQGNEIMQDDFGNEITASAMTAIFNAWIRFVLGDEAIACEYSDEALRQYGVLA